MKFCSQCHGYGCDKCDGLGFVKSRERAHMTYNESNEQGSFSGYIKKHHPTLRFKTNKPESKKSHRGRNEIRKKNSNPGFPDMDIEKPVAPYAGLKIENKRLGTELCLKNGKLKDAYAHQYVCHRQLIAEGYAVYFACSVSEAIAILEAYLSGNALPFTKYELSDKMMYEYGGEFV